MDYTTLAEAKAWLKISTDTDDTVLESLISAESARIDAYLSRALASQSYDIVFGGNGKQSMVFQQYPITAVASVEIDGVAVPAYSSSTGYGYTFSNWRIQLIGKSWTWGVNNCHVVFTAGYATIPADIRQACLELVALRYRERERIGHSSKSIGGETVSFVIAEMTDSVKQKLNQYRRTMTAAWGTL